MHLLSANSLFEIIRMYNNIMKVVQQLLINYVLGTPISQEDVCTQSMDYAMELLELKLPLIGLDRNKSRNRVCIFY